MLTPGRSPAAALRRRWRCALFAGVASLALAGCDAKEGTSLARWLERGKPNPADRPLPADKVTDFAILYQTHCAGCHGAEGKLGPAPPLNDPMFLAIVPDDELLKLVDQGRPGTPMPAFSAQHGGPLTDEQVHALAAGIKPYWNQSKREGTGLPTDLPAYAADKPGNAAADVTHGKELFARACADCHGDDGEGSSAGALNRKDFLALMSDQALRRIIITGRSDLGMPDFAGDDGRPSGYRALTSAEIDDVVALLAQWRTAGQEAAARNQPAAARALLTEARP